MLIDKGAGHSKLQGQERPSRDLSEFVILLRVMFVDNVVDMYF